MVDIKLESKILTLVNIYAPNEDKPTFFQHVLNQLLCFDCSEMILGRDFNLVLDVKKDKKGGRPVTHNNLLKEDKHIASVLDLIDIWRCFNPEAQRFTWGRRKPDIHCRLAFFFLTSSSLSTSITNADMLPGHKTDRSLISIHSANNANPRGLGFWKLNTSFLLDEEYVGLIKKTITDVANEYANNNEIDAILLWDTMKMQIRSSSLNYARRKKAKMKSLELKLESEILSLQKELEENNISENEKVQIYSEIDVKILQREETSKYKTRGAILSLGGIMKERKIQNTSQTWKNDISIKKPSNTSH